jgi:hypothetical protein
MCGNNKMKHTIIITMINGKRKCFLLFIFFCFSSSSSSSSSNPSPPSYPSSSSFSSSSASSSSSPFSSSSPSSSFSYLFLNHIHYREKISFPIFPLFIFASFLLKVILFYLDLFSSSFYNHILLLIPSFHLILSLFLFIFILPFNIYFLV